ncbi:Gfo/Idh/MocA family oxidoreductase, partial [Sphingomonas sp.]|uniref:Gfo/Idh/MocA family protein n=1 Tax=Sphingomonas sp. TaxID=28214 RepID=UPI0025FF6378
MSTIDARTPDGGQRSDQLRTAADFLRRRGSGHSEPQSMVNVGLIGLGYWGPNLLRVLADMEDVAVIRICDLDEDRLHRFCRRHPYTKPTTDFRTMLEDPDIDAVLVATPVQSHFEIASRCLEAGKHTFIEKPLASTEREADALISLADDMDRVLMSGLTFLYSPAVRAIKQLLLRRELGDLYFISSSRVNLGPYRKDVSVVCDLAPHDFSMLLYWMEEMPDSIRAIGKDAIRNGIPDVAFIAMTFASGVVANLEVSWIAPSKLRRTVIVGSKKMVVYEDGAAEQVKLFDKGFDYEKPEGFGEYQLSTRTGDIVIPKLDTAEPLAVELRDFVEAVRRGSGSRESLLLSRDVVRLIEQADISLRQAAGRVA